TADSPQEEDGEAQTGREQSPIKWGTKATNYPETVLIEMGNGPQATYACSGTLIGPRVVLTAGHCVGSFKNWWVTLPFAGNQKTTGKGRVFDYNSQSESVNQNAHDVGLIVLDSPLSVGSYPTIATSHVPDGTKAQNIGRINNGSFSTSALFVGPPV